MASPRVRGAAPLSSIWGLVSSAYKCLILRHLLARLMSPGSAPKGIHTPCAPLRLTSVGSGHSAASLLGGPFMDLHRPSGGSEFATSRSPSLHPLIVPARTVQSAAFIGPVRPNSATSCVGRFTWLVWLGPSALTSQEIGGVLRPAVRPWGWARLRLAGDVSCRRGPRLEEPHTSALLA